MNPKAADLADKIRSLSPDQIFELEEFVEFLRARGSDRGLTRAAATASAPAFEAVWANPDDDPYDAL